MKTMTHWQTVKSLHFSNWLALTFIALFSIQACETIGYENVDTTRKSILVSDAEIRGANFLLRDLVQRRSIDENSAREALQALRDAHSINQEALNAVDVNGDPITGRDKLEKADRALSVALTLISQFTKPETPL